MNLKFAVLLLALITNGCANQPRITESFDLGCEAKINNEIQAHSEVQRLRCYLYFSDYVNAEKQIKVVEQALAENSHKFDKYTKQDLSYYQRIYKNSLGTENSNKGITGNYWLIVKGNPLYPFDAYNRKVEGYVIVSIDITPEGNTENPKVLESNPQGVFDKSAIRAVLKNKYLPRIIDGELLKVEDVQLRLTYSMDD